MHHSVVVVGRPCFSLLFHPDTQSLPLGWLYPQCPGLWFLWCLPSSIARLSVGSARLSTPCAIHSCSVLPLDMAAVGEKIGNQNIQIPVSKHCNSITNKWQVIKLSGIRYDVRGLGRLPPYLAHAWKMCPKDNCSARPPLLLVIPQRPWC